MKKEEEELKPIKVCKDQDPPFPKGKEKVIYRSSYIKNYFVCPKKYLLSTQLDHTIEITDMMRNGLIFEGYCLGWKSQELKSMAIGRKETNSGKQTSSLKDLIARADFVRPLFRGGVSYKRVYHDTKDYRIRGEIDFFGMFQFKGNEIKAIVDLKLTSDIERQWNYIDNKEELLQSVIYPYIVFKNTGKIYPFIYCITENKYDMPLVKLIKVTCTLDDFAWFEKQLHIIHSDLFYRANPDISTCLGSYNRRCSFIQYCTEGRNLVAQDWEIEYEMLKG